MLICIYFFDQTKCTSFSGLFSLCKNRIRNGIGFGIGVWKSGLGKTSGRVPTVLRSQVRTCLDFPAQVCGTSFFKTYMKLTNFRVSATADVAASVCVPKCTYKFLPVSQVHPAHTRGD